MDLEYLEAAAEAVLFASGEPIDAEKLAAALETDIGKVLDALNSLREKLEKQNSAIVLLDLEGKYQLSTRPIYADSIRRALEIKKNAPLSSAALEVLAIIAYNQPVTKAFIEQIRGVDCSGVISTLCSKSLIEEQGRLELPGRPLVYGTTSDFLRCFSLSCIDDLPEIPNSGSADDKNVDEES